jgi:hypothetical protein
MWFQYIIILYAANSMGTLRRNHDVTNTMTCAISFNKIVAKFAEQLNYCILKYGKWKIKAIRDFTDNNL